MTVESFGNHVPHPGLLDDSWEIEFRKPGSHIPYRTTYGLLKHGTIVTPEMFFASYGGARNATRNLSTDAITPGISDTAAIQAAHDWCWNDGNIRGAVALPASDRLYTLTDPNGDGVCLTWNDGVPLIGQGRGSTLTTTAAAKMMRVVRVAGAWRKAPIENIWLDGNDIAAACLEAYGSANAQFFNLTAKRATRGFVSDAQQNALWQNCIAKDCDITWAILNGAGSVVLDQCYADATSIAHVLIDNDPSYPGYALLQSALAYSTPSLIRINGGVYERARGGLTHKTCLRINTGAYVLVEGMAIFAAATGGAESVIDIGRHSLAASYVSASSFSIATADVTSYFPVGTRVRVIGSSGSAVYGIVASSSFSTNTTVALTMDSGQSIPNQSLTVEIGRSDDGAAATWDGTVTNVRLRDVHCYGGSALTGAAIRNGGLNTIIDSPMFLSCSGDWVETSRPIVHKHPYGNLEASKKRNKHIKGVNTGVAEISYQPLASANNGTFEEPGDANCLFFSASGNTHRQHDAVNSAANRTIPLLSTGTSAPGFSASHVGQQFIDTTNSKMYVAKSTGSGASDWMALN